MWFFYLWAIIVGIIDACLWVKSQRVVWWEWAASAAAALLLALIFQYASVAGMTADTETWSGRVTAAEHYGPWDEYYEEAIYRTERWTTTETESYTDSKGKSRTRRVQVEHSKEVFDHWEPRSRHHYDSYGGSSDLCSIPVDAARYQLIVSQWGGEQSHPGSRTTSEHHSRMIGGDPNDYSAVNKNGFVTPVQCTRSFENKIRAAPTAFSFCEVPPNIKVFDYPESNDVYVSNRLLGTANSLGTLAWDQLNAELGYSKKVNVIACGFGPEADSSIAQWQRAKWIGGKKNDVVICYGGGTIARPTWCEVFGWSDSNACKHNLETIVIENQMTASVIPLIKAEIIANYQKKNWHDFDYITVEPPTWSYFVFIPIMLLIQGSMWFFFLTNQESKARTNDRTREFQ